jgi:carbon monoxide dehydrogenase subunit G
MELTDEITLPLPRDTVWAALNDPRILQAAVPGCETFEADGPDSYKVVLAASVGPIKARFAGRMTLRDLRPPEGYALSFEGTGGAAGNAKGTAEVQLHAEGESTRLVYRSDAQVAGRLAQVGARLIDGVARKMAAAFFKRFTEALLNEQAA